jgi:hypothetical protein
VTRVRALFRSRARSGTTVVVLTVVTVVAAGLLALPELDEPDAPARTVASGASSSAAAVPRRDDETADPVPASLPFAVDPTPVAVPQPAPASSVLPPAPTADRVERDRSPAGTSPRGTVEQRGREALESLPYPWEELGYDVRFRPYTGGRLGVADPDTETITVFVKDSQSAQSLRITVAHELGHALDFRTGNDEQRSRYRELRGIRAGTPWFPCNGCDDFASPAGDYAEVFALFVAGRGDFRSRMASEPSDAQLRELAPLFTPPSERTAPPPPPPPSPSPSPSPSPTRLLELVP